MYVSLNDSLALVFSRQANNNQNKPGFLKKNQYTNTKLEVRKIPPELNNITQLNEHFSKFGTIVNIQVKNKQTKTPQFYVCMWVFSPGAFWNTAAKHCSWGIRGSEQEE